MSADLLAALRERHQDDGQGRCQHCMEWYVQDGSPVIGQAITTPFPCDAAALLSRLSPVPPPAGPISEVLEHIGAWAEHDGHYPWIEQETREASAALQIVRDALRQYADDPCTCSPGQPSCCACYSRAALKVVEGDPAPTPGEPKAMQRGAPAPVNSANDWALALLERAETAERRALKAEEDLQRWSDLFEQRRVRVEELENLLAAATTAGQQVLDRLHGLEVSSAAAARENERRQSKVCDHCGERIGVYGWQRPSHSSVGPRALCDACIRVYALAAETREPGR